jgi:hypothetical protein
VLDISVALVWSLPQMQCVQTAVFKCKYRFLSCANECMLSAVICL